LEELPQKTSFCWGVTQVVEHLPSKLEALSANKTNKQNSSLRCLTHVNGNSYFF
jgi:hypothetical protein